MSEGAALGTIVIVGPLDHSYCPVENRRYGLLLDVQASKRVSLANGIGTSEARVLALKMYAF